MCDCVCDCMIIRVLPHSMDSFGESFSSYSVGPRAGDEVVRLGSRYFTLAGQASVVFVPLLFPVPFFFFFFPPQTGFPSVAHMLEIPLPQPHEPPCPVEILFKVNFMK